MFLVLALAFLRAIEGVEIDSITTSVMKDGHVFVHVTSGNLESWGQCTYNNEKTDLYDTIAEKVHSYAAPYAIGKDFSSPVDLDKFADTVWRKNYKRTGTVLAQALAGVDTALWGLVAKSQNLSVCELIAQDMNSTCRDQVPVYGSNGDRAKSPQDIVSNAVANRNRYNVRAFKFQIENRMGGDIDIKPNRTEELIPLARTLLGPNVTLMVDANGGFDNYSHALQIANLLIVYNFSWFEEPFPYWEYDKVAALSAEVEPTLGIATGEQEYRLDVFQRNIKKFRYAQPDVHYIGGVSRTLVVARMSIAANTVFVPHSPNPCMVDVFALSMLASVPNAYEFMEFDAINTRDPPTGKDFFAEPVFELNKDGAMTVPKGAGWGVSLKSGLLKDATNQTSKKGARSKYLSDAHPV
jgi:L-alanine-DL-glutamate epimerase-like enolase superfamily enzyme